MHIPYAYAYTFHDDEYDGESLLSHDLIYAPPIITLLTFPCKSFINVEKMVKLTTHVFVSSSRPDG